jgi:hypothetical protein
MQFTLRMDGVLPLMTHNARLADPLDEVTRAIAAVSKKVKKTDDDHEEMARLEHLGGLYLDPDLGPVMPAANIERCLVDGAKKYKLGTTLKSALLITELNTPILYTGPRDADGLWADPQFRYRASVKVGTSRVMRTRPLFPNWRIEVTGELDDTQIEQRQFEQVVETAGRIIGLGEYRPRFGRFTAEVKFQ